MYLSHTVAASYIQTILIHQCFIWVEEQICFRYRDSPAGSKKRQLRSRKKFDLGNKQHCQAASRVSSAAVQLPLHDSELEPIKILLNPK